MKLVTYLYNGRSRVGAMVEEQIIDLSAVAPDMLSFIELGADGLAAASAAIQNTSHTIALPEVRLLAPIPHPRRNVMCLGLNYAEHAKESYEARGQQVTLPQFPVIFTKATTAVNGPYDDIPYDPAVSIEIDWEVELGVIIGRSGKNISPENALEYVFGYTIINDVTARDLQARHKQFFKGKSLDGSCPMGPWIVTADALQPDDLRITSRVNKITKQDSRTSLMIFDIPAIISHLSRGMTLLPGDIIATGTPSGVGFARTPPEFLQPGDVVTCEVEHIGIIRNRLAKN